jgi:hypothetical protein
MKTRTTIAATLLVLLTIAGCGNPFARPKNGASLVTLCISAARNSRLVSPLGVTAGDIDTYVLFGKASGSLAKLASFAGTLDGASVSLEPGTWDFRLDARDSAGKVLLSGSLTGIGVGSGFADGVTFLLGPLAQGDGAILLTVTLPAGHTAASAGYKLGSEGEQPIAGDLTGKSQLVLSLSAVAAGDLPVFILLRDAAGTMISTISDYAWVRGNLTSTADITLTAADFNSAPAVPSGLKITWSGLSAVLDWTRNSGNETEFVLVQTVDGVDTSIAVTGGLSTCTVADLARGSTYSFRIKAANSFGESGFSDLATSTLPLGSSFEATIDLGSQADIIFSAGNKVVAGKTLSVGVSTAEDGSTFRWYLDGALLAGKTSMSAAIGTTGLEACLHSLMVIVRSGGLETSRTLRFTVVAKSIADSIEAQIDLGSEAAITFSQANEVALGAQIQVSVNQDYGAGNYRWYLDGLVQAGTGKTFTINTSSLEIRQYNLLVVVLQDGLWTSKGMRFKVVP